MTWEMDDRFVSVFIPLQLREKEKCSDKQRTRDSTLKNTHKWPKIPTLQMSVPRWFGRLSALSCRM